MCDIVIFLFGRGVVRTPSVAAALAPIPCGGSARVGQLAFFVIMDGSRWKIENKADYFRYQNNPGSLRMHTCSSFIAP